MSVDCILGSLTRLLKTNAILKLEEYLYSLHRFNVYSKTNLYHTRQPKVARAGRVVGLPMIRIYPMQPITLNVIKTRTAQHIRQRRARLHTGQRQGIDQSLIRPARGVAKCPR